jgi:peptide/nickel transport system permease protein
VLNFVLRRFGVMIVTAICLTFIVFVLTNLAPNLERLAKEQVNNKISDEQVASWLAENGYDRPVLVRYAEWLGNVAKGDFGHSTRFDKPVAEIIGQRLGNTAWLMFWVMITMVPVALTVGVLAGMNEGSKTDRALSAVSIVTTATPEYVSGVVLIAVFATSFGGLKWFKGCLLYTSDAADDIRAV